MPQETNPELDEAAGEPRLFNAVDYDDDAKLLRAVRRRLSDAVAGELQQPGVWAGAIAELAKAYQALGGTLELEPPVELLEARAERDYLREEVEELRAGALAVVDALAADEVLRRGLAQYDTGRLGKALDELASRARGEVSA